MGQNNKSRIYYGWLVCIASTILLMCNMGLCSNLIAVYLPFIEATGISGTQGSSLVTIRCLMSFISSFAVVRYYEKMTLRRGMFTATCVGALSCLIYSFGGSVWVYYLGAAVAGVAYGLGTVIPMSILMNNWFIERKGLAMGICTTGSGFATIIFSPIVTRLVLIKGLRTAYLVQMAFMAVCALIIYVVVRDRPEDIGLEPFGVKTEADYADNHVDDKFKITTVFWILYGIMMLIHGATGTTASAHISILATTSGYSAVQAGLIATVFGLALIVGKIVLGIVTDRIGAKESSIIFILIFALSCLSTLGMDGKEMFFAYAFTSLLGIGNAVFVISFPLWAQELSSKEGYKRTLRIFQILYNAGGIIFTSVPGRIADRTGEYQSSFVLIMILELVAMIIMIVGYRARRNGYHSLK